MYVLDSNCLINLQHILLFGYFLFNLPLQALSVMSSTSEGFAKYLTEKKKGLKVTLMTSS